WSWRPQPPSWTPRATTPMTTINDREWTMNKTLTRWILGIGLPAVVVVGAILARGRGPAEPTDTLHAEEQAEAESHAGEGDEVAVQLDSAALAMAGIRMAEAEAVSTNTLPVTGTITYDQNRVSHIG